MSTNEPRAPEDTAPRRTSWRRGARAAGLAALLLGVGAGTNAWADVAPPPDDDDDDEQGVCLPEKEPGDDCRLPSGDEGTCVDDTTICGFSEGQTIRCHVCEEDCSVAAVGRRSEGRMSWLALGAFVSLGLYRLRRRRPRR